MKMSWISFRFSYTISMENELNLELQSLFFYYRKYEIYTKQTKATMNTTSGKLLQTTSKNDLKYSHRCFCVKN